MWSGGEGSLDAWTAALAARLQLDSPHASRQPSVTVEAAAASTPPTGTGGAPEVLPQPAAGFPKAALHPQQAGPAQEAPPRPRPAPVQTGLHSPMIPGPVPPPFVHQHGHVAACPCLSLLPGPAGTHGLGRGLLHALWSCASTAPTPVAAHGTAVSACQSRRSLTDLTDLCLDGLWSEVPLSSPHPTNPSTALFALCPLASTFPPPSFLRSPSMPS